MRSLQSKKRMAKSNKGMSLIELLVIMMMIAVLLGYMTYNVSVVNGYKARKCKNVLASQISELKVRTLSKAAKTGDIYMEIYMNGNEVCSKIHDVKVPKAEEVEEKIAKRVGVTYGTDPKAAGDGTAIGTEGSGLFITYDRATGAMVASPTSMTLSDVKFIRTKVFDKTYQIELVPVTGKVINRTDKNQ